MVLIFGVGTTSISENLINNQLFVSLKIQITDYIKIRPQTDIEQIKTSNLFSGRLQIITFQELRKMYQNLKNLLKKILPHFAWSSLILLKGKIKSLSFSFKIKTLHLNHSAALKKVSQKKKIKVIFFLIHDSVWKYEGIYRLMEKDNRFDPLVVVCPYIIGGESNMLREMDQAYQSFKHEGYNVIKTLKENGEWLNVKKEIWPDLVCFTNPWILTRPEYLITNFLDTLTCYVPYGFKNSYLYWAHFKMPTQNLVWKFFLETEIHKKLSIMHSPNKGANAVVTGYPGMDIFLEKEHKPVDQWKIKDKKVKRVIWAPHHTLPGMGANLDYSTFLIYAELMLQTADKYKNEIQIAFKPHPVLRQNLSKNGVWGKEKTDQFYQKWAELPNGLIQEGGYIDLFKTSDGMIHDSSSFVIEYLYTGKPVMFLIHDDSISDRFNEIGKMALSNLYQGRSLHDIEYFLNEVIINGNDRMHDDRNLFFNSIVKPPNNITASENIFNYLRNVIFNDTV